MGGFHYALSAWQSPPAWRRVVGVYETPSFNYVALAGITGLLPLFQTPLLVRSLPLRTSTQTPAWETWPEATLWTCFWGSGWRGRSLLSTGRQKGGHSTWSPARWPSPSLSSPSLPSCRWEFYCYAEGHLLVVNWGGLESPKSLPRCCFLDCGPCTSSCPAWRPTPTSMASDGCQTLMDQLRGEPVWAIY